jgi:CheY-like chemotaxis protein
MEKEHIKLPTVVLTAHALNPTAQSSILKYADDVGTKPLSLPKLQELIQKYSR